MNNQSNQWAGPAPDAMRGAIAAAMKEHLVASTDVDGMPIISGFNSATSAILAIAAPVPPADDGAFPRFLGSSSENAAPRIARCLFASDLSNEDHRKIAAALISPSPAVAAEPEYTQHRQSREEIVSEAISGVASALQAAEPGKTTLPEMHQVDICTNSRCYTKPMLAKRSHGWVCPSCGATYGHGTSPEAFMPLPPVRGDREAIAQTNLIRDSIQRVYDEMCVKFSGVHSDDQTDSWLLNLHASLKLLSLHVQPNDPSP